MLRKLGTGFIAVAALAPGLSTALGVGEYRLNSYLNEPLDMTVQLHDLGDLSKDQILAELASQEQFDAAGVERSHFLNNLDFEVILDPAGDGGRMLITSEQAVREPYLDFLVEFLWPTGRLMREYTVLLDPPSYADSDAESRAPVSPARSEAPPSATRAPRPLDDSRQVERRSAPATGAAVERTAAADERAETPRTDSAFASTSAPRTYRVGASDTLWSIAERTRPSPDVSVQRMMMAIQEHNPDAFINDNVNLVREGAVLRLPDQSQARALSNREALARVADQNREWQRLREQQRAQPQPAPLDATGRRTAGDDDAAVGSEGRVTLVTPDSTEGVADGDGTGTQGGGAANTAALQNELAIRDENLDRLRRENDELRSRVGDLDEQMETGQRLLELRNEKITALQEELRRLSEEQGVAIDPRWLEQPASAGEGDSGADDDDATVVSMDGATDTAGNDVAGNAGDPGPGEPGPADMGSDDAINAGDTNGGDAATPAVSAAADADDRTRAEAVTAAPSAGAPSTAEAGTSPAGTPVTKPAGSGGFVGAVINTVMNNLLYLGAGLLVLLLLLLLAVRRRRAGDSEADDALRSDDDGGFDQMPLMADGPESSDNEAGLAEDLDDDTMDPMERADVYVAYGQYPQAVDYLRNEINQTPERADLKIRLLELLRESNDDSGFHQQAALLAGTGAAVDTAIRRLGGDPGDQDYTAIADDPAEDGEPEEELSLDDLELDLASDLSGPGAASDESTLGGDSFDIESASADDREHGDDGDLDLEDFDFRLDDEGDRLGADEHNPDSELDVDLGIDLDADLDGLALDESSSSAGSGENDQGFEFTLAEDDPASDVSGEEPLLASLDESLNESLNESLDEDASAGVTDSPVEQAGDDLGASLEGGELELDDLTLDDLDLDAGRADIDDIDGDVPADRSINVSINENAADYDGDDNAQADDIQPDDTYPENAQSESAQPENARPETGSIGGAVAGDDASGGDLDDLSLDDLDFDGANPPEEPVATAAATASAAQSISAPSVDNDGDDVLGDDEDFDFLGETDENATKLDLARAYIDMGDTEGARDILNEVLGEGDEQQQSEAKELLARVG